MGLRNETADPNGLTPLTQFPQQAQAVVNGANSLGSDETAIATSVGGLNDRVGALLNTNVIRYMLIGDSTTQTFGTIPGGASMAMECDLRATRGNIQAVGTVVNSRPSAAAGPVGMTPYDPMVSGYPMQRIDQITALMQPGGAIYQYVQQFGAPDLIFLRDGINDAFQGASLATIQSRWLTQAGVVNALFPNAKKSVRGIEFLYSPQAPVNGLVATNAVITQYLTWLAATVPTLGPLWSFDNDCDALTDAESFDGIHLNFAGNAQIGQRMAASFEKLFPGRTGLPMPRPFTPGRAQASVSFTNKATDHVTTGGDNGWRVVAGQSFLIAMRIRPTDLGAGGGAFNAILQSSPATNDYTQGWLLVYDNTFNPPLLDWYAGGGGPRIQSRVNLLTLNQEFWLFVHGDGPNGILSFWLATQTSAAAGATSPWVVTNTDVATGVTWPTGGALPILNIGKTPVYAGFQGIFDNVNFYTGPISSGIYVPGFEQIRSTLERIVFEGGVCQAHVGSLPCNDGSGGTVTSAFVNVGGSNGTLTGGGWSAAGAVAWPSD